MKIKIEPITHWDPRRGLVTLTHGEVEIGLHRLGELPRGNLELQLLEPAGESGTVKIERFSTIIAGHRELTPEQLAEWKPTDAVQFARFIVLNAGLKPKVEPAATA